MELKERVPLWDNLKFFLILTVVVGHFIDPYCGNSTIYKSLFVFIYSFHMPLFLFISGLFHKNIRIRQKVCAFLSLYVLLKAVIFILRLKLGTDVKFELLTEKGIPWYMFAMAVFVVLTYLFRDIDKVYLLIAWCVMACFAGYDSSISDWLVLSRIIVFYPFYLLGTMVSRETLEKMSGNKKLRIVCALILLGWLVLCFADLSQTYSLRPLFTGRNPFGKGIYADGWFYRVLCYCITTVVSFCLIMLTPRRRIRVLSALGGRTLQIFFWHRPILYVIMALGAGTIMMESVVGKIGWLMIGALLTLVLGLPVFGFPAVKIMTHLNPSAEHEEESTKV